MPEERLQKLLSQAGVTSRRKAEEMILAGRVTVNGETITELGSKADLQRDHVKVDGTLLHAPHKLVYIALNKPREVVTTVSDPEGRQTVMHLLRGIKERVFPVGRLDYSSEGLLLLTNDGEFAHRLTAPASHVVKTYVVKVTGNLTEEQVAAFAAGIPLHGRRTAPAQIKLIKPGDNPWYEVRLSEGRQNQIRMMFKHFGKLVEKLRRVKIGFLELDLAPGRFRSLTPREVEKFRRILKLDQPDAKPIAAVEKTAEPRPARSAKPALSVRRPRRFAPPRPAEPTGSKPSRGAKRPSGPTRRGKPRV
jgi:23S rRNA pseudouridine2605 synthase